ncbi:hypothetical protein IMCC26207_108255 [Actinobacteria bacterium IMCC26207]|nr:hypothetical protein IMCC26207_108255 [Actinobacteria bacterium IMCC26207]
MTSGMRPEPSLSDELGGSGDLGDPGAGDLGDLGDLGNQLQDFAAGLGDLSNCASLGLAYSQLIAVAYTSDNADAEIDQVLGELQSKAPEDLQDELELVAQTLKDAAGGDFLESTNALSDPEFMKANEAVVTWISTECGG